MTDISQAAKERAVELANEAQAEELRFLTIVWEDRDVCELNGPLLALAKYIDKVSGIAEEVLNSDSDMMATRAWRLRDLVLADDIDPLADALSDWGAIACPSKASESLRKRMAVAGYKIVKDEG